MPPTMLFAAAHPLVHVNASLNTLATLLLILGLVLIKQRNEVGHKYAMMGAFAVSSLFLACYLYYHFVIQLQTPFTGEGPVRYVYFVILASHVILAMAVPPLAIWASALGQRAMGNFLPKHALENDQTTEDYMADCRRRHRRVVKIAFPVWLYVSITGVVVYVMLYHLYPAAEAA